MTVSVVIPTYNRAKFLAQALTSFQDQTRIPHQLLVIDDGSTDETESVVRGFPSATYLRKENGGKSSALNMSLDHVSGDYVWFFDDDDVAESDALERLVSALELNPECGFAFGTFAMRATQGLDLGPAVGASSVPDFAHQSQFLALMEGCFLSGATLMARTSCYREIGGFDERFRRSQDYQMALRLAHRWEGVLVQGGPLFHYRRHEGVRGATGHQISVEDVGRSHRFYDAIIMREWRAKLTQTEYLPGSPEIDNNERAALLQRMSVMVIHRVYPEAIEDLRDVAAFDADVPLSPDELGILKRLVEHTNGLATGDAGFAAALCSYGRDTPVPKIRRALLKLLVARALDQWRRPMPSLKLLWRAAWLVPGVLPAAKRIGRAPYGGQ